MNLFSTARMVSTFLLLQACSSQPTQTKAALTDADQKIMQKLRLQVLLTPQIRSRIFLYQKHRLFAKFIIQVV